MIILIYGLPGTGKSFVAQQLSPELGAVHLSTDMIREKLNAKGHYDEKTKQQVYNELFKQVMRELNQNREVIVDGVFHKAIRRDQLKKLAVERDEPIYLIETRADEETVKKRLRKKRKHSEANFEVYKQLEQQFETEEDHHLELWTHNHSAEEIITAVKDFLNG